MTPPSLSGEMSTLGPNEDSLAVDGRGGTNSLGVVVMGVVVVAVVAVAAVAVVEEVGVGSGVSSSST